MYLVIEQDYISYYDQIQEWFTYVKKFDWELLLKEIKKILIRQFLLSQAKMFVSQGEKSLGFFMQKSD